MVYPHSGHPSAEGRAQDRVPVDTITYNTEDTVDTRRYYKLLLLILDNTGQILKQLLSESVFRALCTNLLTYLLTYFNY